MLILWYASFLVSVVTGIFGISRRSWYYMVISAITFLPISYYFFGINIILKYVGLAPLFLLGLAGFFAYSERKSRVV